MSIRKLVGLLNNVVAVAFGSSLAACEARQAAFNARIFSVIGILTKLSFLGMIHSWMVMIVCASIDA